MTAAQAGRGRIVAIAGEAGAGKTTLVERFFESRAHRVRIHRGACESLSTPEALLPLRDVLRASGRAVDAGASHIKSFELMLGMLTEAGNPTILVIEDLHWADTVTLDLIRFLARRIERLHCLVLLTYRDEEVDSRSPMRAVLGEAPAKIVERLTLEPLSQQAVELLAQRAKQSGAELFALTAGNPFLVTETLAAGGAIPAAAVRDATLARAARLPAEARNVLEAVSIFPRRAETALVAELVRSGFGSGVDAGVERGMLILEGATLRFRHELARRAVEDSLAPTRRRSLHQTVVGELVRRPNARSSEIVHHAERAADVAALTKYARIAGDEAARVGAPREAAAHYGAMLRQRADLEGAVVRDLLERYAEQCYLMGAADLAFSSMLEVVELERRLGVSLKLGRNLTRLTRFAWMCGNRFQAERYVAEAIAVLEQLSPGAELAWAYSHKSQLEMLDSRMESAVAWGMRALELAERLGDQELLSHALGNIGTAKVEHGRSGSMLELKRSYELALAGDFPDHVERGVCNLACTHYTRRDFASALEYIESGVQYAQARELTHWEGYLRGWRAMIQMDQGAWSQAEDEIARVLRRHYASSVYLFPALVALARVRLRRGDADAITPLETVTQLAATLAELQRSVYDAALQAERAMLDMECADSIASIALLTRVHAQAVERNTSWVAEDTAFWLHALGQPVAGAADLSQPFRAFCEGDWAAAAQGWREMGKPYEQALALSEGDEAAQRRALEIFDGLGAAPAAARLRRQMRARGVHAIPRGPIAGTRANAAGLTRRQAQVLALVNDGLSNVEIADRLCISPKTAEHHVSAVIARLGVTRRRDAALAARALGLVT